MMQRLHMQSKGSRTKAINQNAIGRKKEKQKNRENKRESSKRLKAKVNTNSRT